MGEFKITVSEFMSVLEQESNGRSFGDQTMITEGQIKEALKKIKTNTKTSFSKSIVERLKKIDLSEYEKKYKINFIVAAAIFCDYVQLAASAHYELHRMECFGGDEADGDFETMLACHAFALRELTAFANAQGLDLYKLMFDGYDCGMESYGALHYMSEEIESVFTEAVTPYLDTEGSVKSDELDKARTHLSKLTINDFGRDRFYEVTGELWASITPDELEDHEAILRRIEQGGNIASFDESKWIKYADKQFGPVVGLYILFKKEIDNVAK